MKPVSKFVNVAIVGGKAFLLVVRLDSIVGGNDGSNQKRFVNVNPTAYRINNFQIFFLPVKIVRKKAVTESSHNLTGAKTILSVRAQGATYLCLKR
jgi:hypothetical protein